MKVCITGITSGVGIRLAEVLKSEGHDVRGLVREPSRSDAVRLTAMGVHVRRGDLASEAELDGLAEDAEVFFHLAAHVGDWGPAARFVAVNVGGTRRAIDAAARAGVKRFVHLSSTAVYGGAVSGRVEETCETHHSGLPYEDTKLDAERVAFERGRALGLGVVAVRPPGIYGPYDRNFMPRAIDALAKRRCVLIDGGTAPFNLVWVDHLVEVLMKCAHHPGIDGEAFNVADEISAPPPTVREVLETIARAAGFAKPSVSLPYTAALAIGHVLRSSFLAANWKSPPPLTPFVVKMLTRHVVYDASKANRVLGYRPRKRSLDGIFEEAAAFVSKTRNKSNVGNFGATESNGGSRADLRVEGWRVSDPAQDASDQRQVSKATPLWRRVLPTIVALGLLGFVFARIDWHSFSAAMGELNYLAFIGYCAVWVLVLLSADSFGSIVAYRSSTAQISWSEFALVRGASYLPGVLNHHLAQGYLTYVISKLHRVRLARMAGATLLSYAGWLGCLLGCVAIALPLTPLPKWYSPVIIVSGVLYLGVIAAKPGFLSRVSLLSPLFEAGIVGHAKVLFARVPHLLVMVLGTWGSFFFFHVEIPIGTALVYLPILLMAVTLPITPQGFGTRDALAGMFFIAYAHGVDQGDKLAHITACTLSWGVVTTSWTAVVGVIASRRVNRKLRSVGDAGVHPSVEEAAPASAPL